MQIRLSNDWQTFQEKLEELVSWCFEHGKLSLLRTHARLVMHVPSLLTIWRGNIDQKLIESVKQTLKYILKYMMKTEVGSPAFSDIFKQLPVIIVNWKLFHSTTYKKITERLSMLYDVWYMMYVIWFIIYDIRGCSSISGSVLGPSLPPCDRVWSFGIAPFWLRSLFCMISFGPL